jgi:hypothetical protein
MLFKFLQENKFDCIKKNESMYINYCQSRLTGIDVVSQSLAAINIIKF